MHLRGSRCRRASPAPALPAHTLPAHTLSFGFAHLPVMGLLRYRGFSVLFLAAVLWALSNSQAEFSSFPTMKCRPNPLTATAGELRRLLDAGDCTSVELVNLYLKQIAAHNHDGMKLNAMISTAPLDRALEEAHGLDQERREKGPRSRLHGIPIILKVWPSATNDGTGFLIC